MGSDKKDTRDPAPAILAHSMSVQDVCAELATNIDDGLHASEAKARVERYGRNELDDGPGVQPLKILMHQVANGMILVLVVAMAVSFGIKSWIEGGVIAAVTLLNIVVGFFQEFSAEKTMDSLRSLSSPTATVVRDGRTETIPTGELVPGDKVDLKTGDTVPADIRLVDGMNFETDEALLTGESLPVGKNAKAIFDVETGPGDRLNVAYSSSTVTKGRASGIVYATGMKTQIGAIALALRGTQKRTRSPKVSKNGKVKPHRYVEAWTLTLGDFVGKFLGTTVGTPLQKKLSKLAILLLGTAVVCAIIVEAANSFSNRREVIIYAVATGLSMIPASLIVVLTITMAAGTKSMVRRNVVVRKLDSLEALGAVTDICSDKTGTITQGKMVTKKAWIPAMGTYSVGTSDDPIDPTIGHLSHSTYAPAHAPNNDDHEKVQPVGQLLDDNKHLIEFLNVASLANLARVYHSEGSWKARGDPTEIAIQVFASRFDWNRDRFTQGNSAEWTQIAEFPFDSDVKKMSVIFEHKDGHSMVFTKGAVERVLTSCTQVHWENDGGLTGMTAEHREIVLEHMEALAKQGLRVLALASKEYTIEKSADGKVNRALVEENLTFRGLVGLYDPPRPESFGAVNACHAAGIAVHMLTGDHPGTASAIALQVGILPKNMMNFGKSVTDSMVMTAAAFDRLSDDQIDALPVLPLVIARCSPNTKVRMIEALHRKTGDFTSFTAMTGDGVNDAPSLKRADVGVAMGSGSDVAKDASDIVLADDNFASILNAVEEGRRMFDNIQKFVLHLLAENVAQACTLLVGLAFKDATRLSVFPLAPVEILWIIVITSGGPDMGLGFEIAQPGIMSRPPQSLKAGIFTWEVCIDMLFYGLFMAALCLASFAIVLYGFGNGNLGHGCNDSYSADCDLVFRARSTTFVCLTWFALFLAWELTNLRESFFRKGWVSHIWKNKFLFWSILLGFVTIFPTLYIPVINHTVFKHTGISWEWAIVIIASILFIGGIEAWKWGKRIFFRRQARKSAGQGDLAHNMFAHYGADNSLPDEKLDGSDDGRSDNGEAPVRSRDLEAGAQ